MSHACHHFWTCYKTFTFCSLLGKVQNPLRLPRKTTSEPSKVVRTCGVFNILTWKYASCNNGVHFFNISTSKSVPRPSVLNTFDFEIASRHNRVHFDIWTSKSGPRSWVFNTIDFEIASRHNGVHFFDFSTSKSAPRISEDEIFVHFDLETCFAPQRRALFWHLNFKRCSEPGVFCTFWLRNVFRATTACTFCTSQLRKVALTWRVFFLLPHVLRATTACAFSTSTAQLPKVLRTWSVFSFFTSICASRHIGAHFFISHLARWLHTRRFSEPTFRPSGAIGKTQSFLPFRAPASSFFWLFLFSDLLSSALLISDSSRLSLSLSLARSCAVHTVM